MRPIALAVPLFTFLAACAPEQPAAPAECFNEPQRGERVPMTRMPVRFVAGANAVEFAAPVTLSRGVEVTTTKARMLVSQVALIDTAGARQPAELVDANGQRLQYGVAMVDLERPESMALTFRAPPGEYRALALSIGVPRQCESGQTLNHSDASAMKAPLDVDSDMFWSWDPGYVFLKFEGQLGAASAREAFFFHVGGDERFVQLELPGAFSISPQGGLGPSVVADVNRLLTTEAGEARPDILDPAARRVHGGAGADALAENLRRSGFLRLDAALP
jgi:hypothetical protein